MDSGMQADVSADAPASDGPIDLFDVFPLGDAGCPACIRDRCGTQINACLNNPACATGLFCTLQMCAGGLLGGDGGYTPADLLCVFGCFNGDQATAITAIGSLTCITMTCGGSCSLGDAAVADVRPPDDAGLPDASADSVSEGGVDDGGVDVSAPETGTTADANGNADADAGTPSVDAPADAATGDSASNDAGSDPADPTDAGSTDTTPDFAPPSQDTGAD
jgi:hypothetical protein